jgi:hypothetical protein
MGLRSFTRRAFVKAGAGLFGLGAAGLVGGCERRPSGQGRDDVPDAYRYDITRLAADDGGLPRWNATRRIETGLVGAAAMAALPDGRLALGLDRALAVLDEDGNVVRRLTVDEPVTAVATEGDDGLVVAGRASVQVLGPEGALREAWTPGDERSRITSVARSGVDLFVADAGRRTVSRYRGGDRVWTLDGFHVPSPYFDLAVAGDRLWVAHTGKHRLEAYDFTGDLERHWGKASMQIDGFCGCCNPCHFVIRADGRFVTSEKGLHRVKVCGSDGRVESLVANAELLGVDVNAPMPRHGATAVPAGPLVADRGERGVAVYVPRTGVLHGFTQPTA